MRSTRGPLGPLVDVGRDILSSRVASILERPRKSGSEFHKRERELLQMLAWRGKERSVVNARTIMEAACRDIIVDGKAINLRELNARVPKEVLGSIRGVIDVLQEIKETLDAS